MLGSLSSEQPSVSFGWSGRLGVCNAKLPCLLPARPGAQRGQQCLLALGWRREHSQNVQGWLACPGGGRPWSRYPRGALLSPRAEVRGALRSGWDDCPHSHLPPAKPRLLGWASLGPPPAPPGPPLPDGNFLPSCRWGLLRAQLGPSSSVKLQWKLHRETRSAASPSPKPGRRGAYCVTAALAAR